VSISLTVRDKTRPLSFYGFRVWHCEAQCADVCPFNITSAPWYGNVRQIRAWVSSNLSVTGSASLCLS